MVKNANSAPQLQELPVSDKAADLIHRINIAHFPSQLRKIGGRELVGLSEAELDIVSAEKEARQKLMVVTPEQPPLDVPVAPVQPTAAPWSPIDILDTIPDRDPDFRERAAGEHLDR